MKKKISVTGFKTDCIKFLVEFCIQIEKEDTKRSIAKFKIFDGKIAYIPSMSAFPIIVSESCLNMLVDQ